MRGTDLGVLKKWYKFKFGMIYAYTMVNNKNK